MRIADIKDFDICQADGVSVSLWTQGCPHRCKGCYNESTWDFEGGVLFTKEHEDLIISALSDTTVPKSLSILGGEPLIESNLPELTNLVQRVKKELPSTKIWCWTGYSLTEVQHLEILKYIDVLIDGKFLESKKEITRYKGSSNQNIIYDPCTKC